MQDARPVGCGNIAPLNSNKKSHKHSCLLLLRACIRACFCACVSQLVSHACHGGGCVLRDCMQIDLASRTSLYYKSCCRSCARCDVVSSFPASHTDRVLAIMQIPAGAGFCSFRPHTCVPASTFTIQCLAEYHFAWKQFSFHVHLFTGVPSSLRSH